MRKTALVLLILFLPFWIYKAKAQEAVTDTSRTGAALRNAENFYKKAAGEQSYLYNGSIYPGYPFTFIEGQPYFLSADLSNGTVVYEGVEYENVPMQFDLIQQELVILHYNHYSKIRLLQERVSRFKLHGHTFIRLIADSASSKAGITTGFYDEIYSGKTILLAKRDKNIQTTTTISRIERRIDSVTHYFLVKNGIYQPVSTKRSFLNQLKDEAHPVKKFIKKNKIKFRKDKEASMIRLTRYYDELKD